MQLVLKSTEHVLIDFMSINLYFKKKKVIISIPRWTNGKRSLCCVKREIPRRRIFMVVLRWLHT